MLFQNANLLFLCLNLLTALTGYRKRFQLLSMDWKVPTAIWTQSHSLLLGHCHRCPCAVVISHHLSVPEYGLPFPASVSLYRLGQPSARYTYLNYLFLNFTVSYFSVKIQFNHGLLYMFSQWGRSWMHQTVLQHLTSSALLSFNLNEKLLFLVTHAQGLQSSLVL